MTETLTKSWDGITLREKMCDVGSPSTCRLTQWLTALRQVPDPEGFGQPH